MKDDLLTIYRADQEFGKLLQILEDSKEIVVIEGAEEWEDDEKTPVIEEGQLFKIPGSVVSFVERLDDELTRSLQHIDPHTAEYVERLTDESALYAQLVRTSIYVESLQKREGLEVPQESANRVVMRRLEHVYFKVNLRSCYSVDLLANIVSPLPLSKSSRTRPGRRSHPTSTPQLLPAPFPPTHPLSSRRSAHTSSGTARALSVLGPCSARFTSWLCTTSTTRLAT
jgi:translation initiation factor 3 subunit C